VRRLNCDEVVQVQKIYGSFFYQTHSETVVNVNVNVDQKFLTLLE